MSLLDDLFNAGQLTANITMMETRSNVSRNLTSLVSSALPKTNRIPGPLGGFAEKLERSVTSSITSPISNLINPNIVQNPSAAISKIGDGINQVFNAIGVPRDTNVLTSNPRVYQNAVSAASGIWNDVQSGSKTITQIVDTAQEPLTLLKYTHDVQVNTTTSSVDSLQSLSSADRPTPYAMDLFRLAPKHKFLFVVEFVFNGGYDFIGSGKRSKNDFAVTIRDFDRPKVKYEYEENVNFYNFRTPVIKRVVHDPLSIKFLDDRQNLAMNFFGNYMKATSPITNVDVNSAFLYESNGMNAGNALNSASFGPLDNNLVNILKEIKVYHIYDFGAKMNIHHFVNPKVVSIEHDSWTMVDSEGSYITANFVYDAWSMELGVNMTTAENDTISTLSNTGNYSMHPKQTSPSINIDGIAAPLDTNISTIASDLGGNTGVA